MSPYRRWAPVAMVLMGWAWLMPVHWPVWLSFHSDALAATGFGCLAMAVLGRRRYQVSAPLLSVFIVGVALVPIAQASVGIMHFWGDAWMVVLHLLGFALAITVGRTMLEGADGPFILRCFWSVVLAAGVISVGLQLQQWLRLDQLGGLVASVAVGGRPYANLGQPNHLATLLMLGMVATLALRQEQVLGRGAMALALVWLAFGAVMTQSRTAWLAMACLVTWLIAIRPRTEIALSPRWVLALGLAFLLLTLAWTPLAQALYLDEARSAAGRYSAGSRPMIWGRLLGAVAESPWAGYGWNQVAVAMFRTALGNPVMGTLTDHSHNLAIDLLVWNGVPLGLTIILVVSAWFWRQVRGCRSARPAYLLAGVGVIFVHALLEYPIEYAYFLLPLGLMMGAVEATTGAIRSLRMPRALLLGAASAAAALFVWTCVEYMQVEENYRNLRLQSARIGTGTISPEAPQLTLLTQLREFLVLARQKPAAGRSDDEMRSLRKVAERYGFPPVLIRYAATAALNGRPDEAADVLRRLCSFYERGHCDEGRVAWQEMSQSHPALASVRYPASTSAP